MIYNQSDTTETVDIAFTSSHRFKPVSKIVSCLTSSIKNKCYSQLCDYGMKKSFHGLENKSSKRRVDLKANSCQKQITNNNQRDQGPAPNRTHEAYHYAIHEAA